MMKISCNLARRLVQVNSEIDYARYSINELLFGVLGITSGEITKYSV